ncbi:MxaD gene product [Methylocaldum marinum]|uniref:MxaD gene product n=1 Tax=Methylocaldum marinum TaxID=1432792 RepID=A0A250KS30_9GAMM|nr:SRPBCC family protein [Methylocaldum marinum]BBA34372.1 MxaD gene product [Methylocaldum marinum]
MKKLLSLVAVLSLLWVGFANAHGPTRQKVTESIEINAAPEAVWALVGDWANLQNWLPVVESSTAQGSTEKGATRELKLKSGGVIKEELKSYDASKMTLQYKINEVDPKDLPVANYSASIKVEPNPAGGSKVVWNGAFYRSFMNNNPPPEESDEAAVKAVTAIYKEGLANLKAVAEQK